MHSDSSSSSLSSSSFGSSVSSDTADENSQPSFSSSSNSSSSSSSSFSSNSSTSLHSESSSSSLSSSSSGNSVSDSSYDPSKASPYENIQCLQGVIEELLRIKERLESEDFIAKDFDYFASLSYEYDAIKKTGTKLNKQLRKTKILLNAEDTIQNSLTIYRATEKQYNKLSCQFIAKIGEETQWLKV